MILEDKRVLIIISFISGFIFTLHLRNALAATARCREVLLTPVISREDVNPSSHQYPALILMPIVCSMGAVYINNIIIYSDSLPKH